MSKYSIKRAAILMVLATIIEKALGFGREMVIASQFGATGLTDAYIGGYLVPYFIMALLYAGLVNVYSPLFLSEKEADEDMAWEKINSISSYLLILILFMTVIGIVFSGQIIKLLYPGFTPENIEAAASISRIFFIGVFIYSGTIIEGALLNCYRQFIYPLIAISLLSAGIIAGVFLFGGSTNINSIAYGYMTGAAIGLILQFMKLKSIDKRFSLNLKMYPEFTQKFFGMLLPILIATSMSQVNVFVDRIFASYLAEGSMSYLSYGNKVVELPITLFAGIISTIIFPDLIDYINKEDRENLKIYLNKALIISLIFLIPSFAGLITLRMDVVKLLYERNVFTSSDTINTSLALLGYSPTIILYGGTAVISKVYYSMRDTKTLMYISLFTIFLNALMDYFFMKTMRHLGLALATSLVAVFQFGMAYWMLKKKISISMGTYLLKNLIKICAAAAVMSGVITVLNNIISISSHTITVAILILAGVSVYFALIILFKVDEVKTIIDKIRKRGK
ncbi:putative peptidoglycan biosynthesis protein MurJ [Oxobacter pfennigii]|uniref:Probable lipid II flippase MurJ n=1 Tax=Oxobacter pfennigii TaxID=36849 RepID=A0A0N8NTN9_9CLOT|nr:murein biosynthesis integral membrane protein MurJ [Oxobacter pfennigii]KPU45360.1 putative peptidoglycan biosynthesis protein MurJ [Oxobacter pfennigii]